MSDTSYARRVTDLHQRHGELEARQEELETAEAREAYLDKIRRNDAFADDQALADDALSVWNRRAPAPRAYEQRSAYRRRLARIAGEFLPPGHQLKGVRLDDCTPSVVGIFYPEIMKAVREAVTLADTVPKGELRQIDRHDGVGRKITTFVGRKSFVVDMQAPSKRVVQFAKMDGAFRE
jgi:hypothetical protein